MDTNNKPYLYCTENINTSFEYTCKRLKERWAESNYSLAYYIVKNNLDNDKLFNEVRNTVLSERSNLELQRLIYVQRGEYIKAREIARKLSNNINAVPDWRNL